MRKLLIILLVILLCLSVLSGCDGREQESVSESGAQSSVIHDHSFLARIIEINNGSALVEPLDNEWEKSSASRISFDTSKLEDIEVDVGDVVCITYEGEIMESFPAQVKATGWSILRGQVTLLHYNYFWCDVSKKIIPEGSMANKIIGFLEEATKTGEIEKIVSDGGTYDDEVSVGGVLELPVKEGTIWIEYDGKIYRVFAEDKRACLVQSHLGDGELLRVSDEFWSTLGYAWSYYPRNVYLGTYDGSTGELEIDHIYAADTAVSAVIKEIDTARHCVTVVLNSIRSDTFIISMSSYRSDDDRGYGDSKDIELEAGVDTEVELCFGDEHFYWDRYWLDIYVDNTTIEINVTDPTPKDETGSDFIVTQDGDTYVALPKSNEKLYVSPSQLEYLDLIDYKLLRDAELKIAEAVSEHGQEPHYYIGMYNGEWNLCAEIIIDLPVESEDGYIMGGCGIDHEHLFFREKIEK